MNLLRMVVKRDGTCECRWCDRGNERSCDGRGDHECRECEGRFCIRCMTNEDRGLCLGCKGEAQSGPVGAPEPRQRREYLYYPS